MRGIELWQNLELEAFLGDTSCQIGGPYRDPREGLGNMGEVVVSVRIDLETGTRIDDSNGGELYES